MQAQLLLSCMTLNSEGKIKLWKDYKSCENSIKQDKYSPMCYMTYDVPFCWNKICIAKKVFNFKRATAALHKLAQWLEQHSHAADPEAKHLIYIISKLQSYMLKIQKEAQL